MNQRHPKRPQKKTITRKIKNKGDVLAFFASTPNRSAMLDNFIIDPISIFVFDYFSPNTPK
jgi:signal peptidase I